jgi:hypothetical protein
VSLCVSAYRCQATTWQTRSHNNKEFLEASLFIPSLSCRKKVGDWFLPELNVNISSACYLPASIILVDLTILIIYDEEQISLLLLPLSKYSFP